MTVNKIACCVMVCDIVLPRTRRRRNRKERVSSQKGLLSPQPGDLRMNHNIISQWGTGKSPRQKTNIPSVVAIIKPTARNESAVFLFVK